MKGRRIYMLEKMFTTKMSADKKKLQSRFTKIRSKSGKFSKLFGGIVFGIIIIAIIGVGVIIAVNNTKDYIMTDAEFSDYINRPIGSIMADLDYVDEKKAVFHYLEGFFVIDRQNNEIIHKINLGKLNIAGHTQGDSFTVFKIDKDGEFAYLTNEGNEELFDNYIINLKTGEVKIGNAPDGTEFFINYADTFTEVENPYGWYSDKCVVDGDKGVYYMTVEDGMTASMKLVYLNHNAYDNSHFSYVFTDDYISYSQKMSDIIVASLKDGEEIITNSGFHWELNEEEVNRIYDKLSETRNMKLMKFDDGNYYVGLYYIWQNEQSHPMIFIIDNYSFELKFSMRITSDEYNYFVNMLNYPDVPTKEFYPQDIKEITHAEIVVKYNVYPILVRDNLEKIEQMLSNAKIVKGGTGCSFDALMIITRQDGEQGVITLATDSCAVYKTGDTYYDYSDGDNSEMLGFFGLDSKYILELTR